MEMARKKAIPGMISPAEAMSNMTQASVAATKWYYTEWEVDFDFGGLDYWGLDYGQILANSRAASDSMKSEWEEWIWARTLTHTKRESD